MHKSSCPPHTSPDRRSFLKKRIAAGAVGAGVNPWSINLETNLSTSVLWQR